MRGGALPPALVFAALGLVLGYAPWRTAAPAALLAAAAAGIGSLIPTPAPWQDALFVGLWASIAVTAAAVHLPGGPGRIAIFALALNDGSWSGLAAPASLGHFDLLRAAPALLTVVPASLAVRRGWGLAVKVAASWLAAVAILAASLTLVPTPGYKPDHMD